LLSPSERKLRARVGAYALHAQGGTSTKAASAAFLSRFDREVDPDGLLLPDERARRAAFARKGYMAKLALKASRAHSRQTVKTGSEISRPEPVEVSQREPYADHQTAV
jgi:hypothetical protein